MEKQNNQPAEEEARVDFRLQPLVYARPGMSEATRQRDITYKTLENGSELKMDVYYPDSYDGQALLPAVLFVHGDADPEVLSNAKDWACYVGWGELVASIGLAAVTFTHRSTERLSKAYESAADVDDLIAYVRAHSHDLGIDAERLAIWTCSAGAYRGLRAALRNSPSYVRCAVSYYGVMDLRSFFAEPEEATKLVGEETLKEFAVATYLQQESNIPPLFIARAGLDYPSFNASIDEVLRVALQRNLDVTFMNHATGHHAFDAVDDNERSHEIIRATLEFFKIHLSEAPGAATEG